MEAFVKTHFIHLYPIFQSIPVKIIKLDLFRFLVLYTIGGIYLDLDIFVYKNFYDNLDHNVAIQQTVVGLEHDEIIQNALICASPKDPFILECINESIGRIKHLLSNLEVLNASDPNVIKSMAGPYLMSDVYQKYEPKSSVQVLPNTLYNPSTLHFSSEHYCKHLMTGT